MPTRRGVLVGAVVSAGVLAAPADAAGVALVRVQHSSLQYSDPRREHAHDAHALFRHAHEAGAALVSGTESGGNSLSWQIPRAAHRYGYACRISHGGDWVAVRRTFGAVVSTGYVPVYAGNGAPASQGGHAPRGIVWARVRPADGRLGPLTFGASHWLTRRSLRAARLRSNARMIEAVRRWSDRHGGGRALVFYAADTNVDDRRRDVFAGAPLTTCWDELGRHPDTLNRRSIDVIASRDADGRVSCRGARVLGDAALFLFSDHRTIEAAYRVRP